MDTSSASASHPMFCCNQFEQTFTGAVLRPRVKRTSAADGWEGFIELIVERYLNLAVEPNLMPLGSQTPPGWPRSRSFRS